MESSPFTPTDDPSCPPPHIVAAELDLVGYVVLIDTTVSLVVMFMDGLWVLFGWLEEQ